MGFRLPNILFNSWFYFGLIGVVIVINYFWGKPLPIQKPEPEGFFVKHKKLIIRITDIVMICFIVFINILLFLPVKKLFNIFPSHEDKPIESRLVELSILYISLMSASGYTAIFIGLLSVFQKNITVLKRIFLFIISFLPMLFAIFAILKEPNENHHSTIINGLSWVFNCILINGPAIILGRSCYWFWWLIMQKLRLVSGEYIDCYD